MPQSAPRHKVFVSFHHEDQAYKDRFVRGMGHDFVDESVEEGDIDDARLQTDTIRQKIRDEFIADAMAELGKVSARKATLLNPTREGETVHVLRRRLFEAIDEARVEEVVQAYRKRWDAHQEVLPPEVRRPATVEDFRTSYPFHPEVLETLTTKTATLESFQRVRGMLRLLGK